MNGCYVYGLEMIPSSVLFFINPVTVFTPEKQKKHRSS